MVVNGYHTLEDRDNFELIEQNGPILCVRNDAWLGIGYYFWDTNIDWGHEWGRKTYKKYVIFKAIISLINCYDLVGNVSDKSEFNQILNVLQEKQKNKNIKVSEVLEYMKKFTDFNYNTIRSAHFPDSTTKVSFGGKFNEFMFSNERVQICVIKKNNLTLQNFKVIYPDEYCEVI
jgi:hypothetical protein